MMGLILTLLSISAAIQEDTLEAGAASRDITPMVEPWEDADGDGRYDKGEKYTDTNRNGKFDYVWMAGFRPGRSARRVHDPLTAQALVLRSGKTVLAIVALDLVGFLYRDVVSIRIRASKQTGIPQSHIIISSTHNHASSDTVGIWGGFPGLSGRNKAYLKKLESSVVEAIVEAHRGLRPVRTRYAQAEIKGLVGDSRKPVVINEWGRAMLFETPAGKAVASFVNFSCHPEARGGKNREITSDYPHYVRRDMRKKYGVPCIFTVGDIGGLISPRVGRRWEDLERMGSTIARKVAAELDGTQPRNRTRLKVAAVALTFPLRNKLFQRAARAGNFGNVEGYITKHDDGSYTIISEMTAVRLGDIVLVTVPGEIFPELAQKIYDRIEAKHKVMLGLANDELGYIIPESSWDRKKYEESMSIGSKTGTILLAEATKLLKGF